MWFFILAELAVFGILILAFIVTQALHPELFRTGRQALDGSTGLALTLSLLTAGWCAALALARARQGLGRAPLPLGAALSAASCFVALRLPGSTEEGQVGAEGVGTCK